MDPTEKRRFTHKWDRRQQYVRDTIKDHLFDRAVETRIDWLHHRDLEYPTTLSADASTHTNLDKRSNRQGVTKLMSPFPKSAADVVEDYESGSFGALKRTNLDIEYRAIADDDRSRWEEELFETKPKQTTSEEVLRRVRESFSEKTLRLIDRTQHGFSRTDKLIPKYMDLTRRHLGIIGEDDSSSSDEDEETPFYIDEEKNLMSFSLPSTQVLPQEDEPSLNLSHSFSSVRAKDEYVSIGTSAASPEQRKALRRRKRKKFGYSKAGGGGIGDDVPMVTPDEERRAFSLLNPRMGTPGHVWTVTSPMVWTPETTITTKGYIHTDGTTARQPSEVNRFKGKSFIEKNSVKISRSPMVSRVIDKEPGTHHFRHEFVQDPNKVLENWHSFRSSAEDVQALENSLIDTRTKKFASNWETKAKSNAILFQKQRLARQPQVPEDAARRYHYLKGSFVSTSPKASVAVGASKITSRKRET
jgi:hypothetical protein